MEESSIIFLIVFGLGALIALGFNIAILYMDHRQSIKAIQAMTEEIDFECIKELSNINNSELAQTQAGRQLIVLLKNDSFNVSSWKSQIFRRREIELARQRERLGRMSLIRTREDTISMEEIKQQLAEMIKRNKDDQTKT